VKCFQALPGACLGNQLLYEIFDPENEGYYYFRYLSTEGLGGLI
jgi:hypothetical protein